MNEISTHRLRAHVYELASKIGEHNIFHPDALHAAEAYITAEWRQQGYDVCIFASPFEKGGLRGIYLKNLP